MKSILQEAEEVTSGDRNEAYGHALDNHLDIAAIWSVILRKSLKEGVNVSPEQAALMMIGLKIAREGHAHRRDNLVDMAGYAKCADEIHAERERRGSKIRQETFRFPTLSSPMKQEDICETEHLHE